MEYMCLFSAGLHIACHVARLLVIACVEGHMQTHTINAKRHSTVHDRLPLTTAQQHSAPDTAQVNGTDHDRRDGQSTHNKSCQNRTPQHTAGQQDKLCHHTTPHHSTETCAPQRNRAQHSTRKHSTAQQRRTCKTHGAVRRAHPSRKSA